MCARELLDQLHCQVGELLTRTWRVTDVIQAAIAHHPGLGCHQAELAPSTDFGFNALKLTDADTVQEILDTVKEHTSRLLQTY